MLTLGKCLSFNFSMYVEVSCVVESIDLVLYHVCPSFFILWPFFSLWVMNFRPYTTLEKKVKLVMKLRKKLLLFSWLFVLQFMPLSDHPFHLICPKHSIKYWHMACLLFQSMCIIFIMHSVCIMHYSCSWCRLKRSKHMAYFFFQLWKRHQIAGKATLICMGMISSVFH